MVSQSTCTCSSGSTASYRSSIGEGKLQVRINQAIGNKMKKIYLYVLDGMAEWEIGNILQALSMEPQLKNGRQDYRIHTISHNGKPVKTLGGLTIAPEGSLEMLSGAMVRPPRVFTGFPLWLMVWMR